MSTEADERGPLPAVGIVADDLTGAGDCAVKFAEAGWEVELGFGGGFPALGAGAAIATTTDVRALSETDASRLTEAAVTALLRAGAQRLYVKIDSTLRGSVGGQIAGALYAWRAAVPDAFALVCPAYPAMGRTMVDGRLLVHGELVDAGALDAEPMALVGASVDDDVSSLLAAGREHPVLFIDAASDADLDRLASVIAALGRGVLPVGSAGLAGAIARRAATAGAAAAGRARPAPELKAPALVAVSSRHPIATAQVEVLLRELGSDDRLRLVMAPTEPVHLGDGVPGARLVADRLADEVARQAAEAPIGSLVLVGGDGALAVLRRLGAASVRVHGSAVEGVPLGVVRGGVLDGVTVLTKSGGFGDETVLHELVQGIAKEETP